MSKFKKILVITLMLALTLTAFAVVSLAADEPRAVNVGGHKTDTTFETFALGESTWSLTGSAGTNGGLFINEAYPGGNKYLEMIGSTGSAATTRYTTFISDDYGRRTTYTLGNYPIVAVDFDIMSPDGNWGLYSATNTGNSSGLYFRPYVGSQMQGAGLFGDVTFGLIGLSEEKSLWQHVTVVFELSYSNYGESLISQRVYVNGELTKDFGEKNMSVKYPTIDSSKLFIGPIYFRTSRYQAVSHQAIDNIQFTYFEAGYDSAKVPTNVYKDNYEFPYGTTIARIGRGYYDSIPKAIEAAKAGDVIRLVADIDGVVNVDKTVVFDTNKYDEAGNPTGEHYSIKTSSTTLVSETENGFISFEQMQNASLQIYWDDCPGAAMGGECTCPKAYLDENGEHIMAAFTASAMLNSTPLYPGEIPEFEMNGATEKRFIGWSLEQGGKPVELAPITSEQVSDGWLSLYPVYEEYTYAFEVISKDGVSTFYPGDTADEVKNVFSKAPAGSTIKLHKDVRVPTIELAVKDLTLDLNGYSYINLTTQVVQHYEEYDEEAGANVEKTKTTEITTDGKGSLFYDKNSSVFNFTIKSSRPGSVMASLTVSRYEWLDENGAVIEAQTKQVGKVVARRLVTMQNSQMNFCILGNGTTFYSDEIFVSEYNNSKPTLTIDGGTYCYVPEETSNVCGLFSVRTGGPHYIKNATIYCNGDYLYRNTDRDKNTKITYENCDIYNAKISTSYANDTHFFENCRLNLSTISGTVIIGHNNLLTSAFYDKYVPRESDAELEEKPTRFVFEGDTVANSVTESHDFYTPVADYTKIIDAATLLPVTLPGVDYKTVEFAYQTYNPLYAPTEVTLKDFNGNVIYTVTANQNKPLATPEAVSLGDGYRAVTNPLWINEATGEALGDTLGSEASYVFKATLPAEPEYKASLTVAMMNMAYYNGFAYNLYLPKTEAAQFVSVCGEALSGDVILIEGEEYYIYTILVDATKALDDFIAEVKYVVDEAEYTAEFVLSAYVYAVGSIESDKHSDEDKAASAALIKYIEELYKYVANGEDLSSDVNEKLEAFYTKKPFGGYSADYPAEEKCEVNSEAIDGYIDAIYFRILRGSRVGIAVELKDEAVAAGYTLKIGGKDFDTVKNGELFYTDSTPVYLALTSPIYEISIVDADGATVASTQYSMATYILAMEAKGQNVDVVKALYEFGKATLAIRNKAFA